MFGRSELLGTLREVAGAILVPATVFGECTRETAKPGVQELLAAANLGTITVEADPRRLAGLGLLYGSGALRRGVVASRREPVAFVK